VAWRPGGGFEIAVVGQNLAQRRHAEFASGALVARVPRGAYGQVTWRR